MRNRFYITVISFVFILGWTSCKKDDPETSWTVDFSDCIETTSSQSLEVVTFNIEHFRLSSSHDYNITIRIPYIASIIGQLDADVVALQEIGSEYVTLRLADELPGWEGVFTTSASGNQSLAYLYKTSEVELYEEETEAIAFGDEDWFAFPRLPFKIKIHHAGTGMDVYLINNHLKCCGGNDNKIRRREASEKLQDYIDNQLADQPVIVLGDYNDYISEEYYSDNVFWNFVEDSDNYRFADMEIAMGDDEYWSYPGDRYTSHLDHILITNELFDVHQSTSTIRPSYCYSDYLSMVSDHRPVMAVFR
ncbi:endonuclease/exonuclease/phosphatase family protein [Carboxylicivirga linearis]|uniref:Endonuclease/exonuclease/phosphatase family protein n=1 Tax=Carboxylicivirga linearis TaxID=1628157 RepID=A0ABS5JW00_9BACT|nr:endonuclease/exonuclease/phosphatase family protein [Carboxylicivirga linearis]MBS2098516.1 endonuclease/exonuclease/phosphatase family protein [Carboxylicivirga linearis]